MEIPENLIKFKYHIFFTFLFFLISLSLLYIAPSFINILAYFWPLLLSTALFLITVLVFGLTSPPGANVSGEKAGEGILDYVAGATHSQPLVVQSDFGEGTMVEYIDLCYDIDNDIHMIYEYRHDSS
ncbi:hypothetical protein QVD17_06083 [Tagetes erecta]|uniref:Uncharacterized protein n=1 Tax=Tagetes erecta TaxID=13708 RepID=A0AAD8LIR0_TARER|nr:hypothetical protein QVD17_06083 [Tagetes erecta]